MERKQGKKLNLLYDASVLINGAKNSTARSGVYFVAYNLLLEMLKREDLSVKIYCYPKYRHLLDEVINNDENLKNLSIAKYSKIDKMVIHFEYLKYQNKQQKNSKIVRVAIKTLLNCFKFISEIGNTYKINQEYKKIFKEIDAFFSPWQAVPQEIKNISHIKKYELIHDVIPLIFPENFPDMQDEKSSIYKRFHSFDNDVFYFANSEYTKQDFVKHTNISSENVAVIPLSTGIKYDVIRDKNQIDLVKEKYNIPKNKKYLFSLCTLEPRKNLVFAVKNFIEFIKRNNIDDFVFVLGGGHWKHFIEQLNDAIGDLDSFQDKIIKIGYVFDEDLAALYGGAEMFVFPSLYEGFGMPILEAMKCGCPVICSNVSSMPEVIGDCGIQINPTDDEELINAFKTMYFDGEQREKFINKGLDRAKSFTWEKSVDVIIEEISKNV